jgi:hypothetical protein
MDVSQLHIPAVFTSRIDTGTDWTEGWLVSEGSLEVSEKKQMSCPVLYQQIRNTKYINPIYDIGDQLDELR